MAHSRERKALLPDSSFPGGLKSRVQDAIEVKLWEVYLIRSRTGLRDFLAAYSLDHGPKPMDGRDPDRVTFRFMRYDWDKSIEQMLLDRNVPFQIIRQFQVDVLRLISKKRVYVVEDDLSTLFALNTILENAGYDVILSHSGLRLLEKGLPATDLFILDKRMPDIDGLDVCSHLRQQEATRNIPIVMISATRDFKQKALSAGVNDCLEKPFQMDQLLGLVAKHTEQ